MKILVTGSDGMVGKALCEALKSISDIELTKVGRDQDIRTYQDNNHYYIIYHCAAKKDLNWCHNNAYDAYDINVNGTNNIAKISSDYFIFISSDMVADKNYNGFKYPSTVYGQTKKLAEDVVLSKTFGYIIRSGVIYPERINWIDEIVTSGEPLKLYYDRWRMYIPLKKYINMLIGLINNPRGSIIKYATGDIESQLTFGLKYLDRINIKYPVIPISRKETTHGSFGEDIVL